MNFIIKGSCVNPKITHLETGKTLSILGTFTSTNEIIIDSKTFTIVKNKTTNLLSNDYGDFLQLVEGDNGFKFECESIMLQ
jgi:phage-related protein